MSFWLKDLNRNIVGKGTASTKKLASQNCSVSLVHQLYHMGIIEGAEAGQIGAKKKSQPVVSLSKEFDLYQFYLFYDFNICITCLQLA